MFTVLTVLVATCLAFSRQQQPDYSPVWTWECVNNRCEKILLTSQAGPKSLNVCKLVCSDFGGLWPKPSGSVAISHDVLPVNYNSINIKVSSAAGKDSDTTQSKAGEMLLEAGDRFKAQLLTPNVAARTQAVGLSFTVNLYIEQPEVISLYEGTDESYSLTVEQTDDGKLTANIRGVTYFGARHGLETLGQMVIYDSVSGGLVVPRQVSITDKPVYPYRGILLDTSRNFISIPVIRKVIEGMAANKLNTFHWHITDSHSFPFQSITFPQLTQYGAYSPEQVYTTQDILELVEYARARGVRVIPELDAPAHVGEGWQWAQHQNATVCFKAEPWLQYCVEPPCGQLNPTSDFVYNVLQGIYADMEKVFDSDYFHMGGDEVNFNCWNSTEQIAHWMHAKNIPRDADGFHQLWSMFQNRAVQMLDSVSNRVHPIILWTSSLTEAGQVDKYLDKSRYIIQIWTTGHDKVIAELVREGFRVIFSNYDALYFDCGFGAWVGEGNNWCSPYIGWQKVYENDPMKLLKSLGVEAEEGVASLVLGQEATLWTEEADDQSVEQRLFPRVAAMAERLWTNPTGSWRDAEYRFVHHRERLVNRGIAADTVQPQWCHQNEGYCYM